MSRDECRIYIILIIIYHCSILLPELCDVMRLCIQCKLTQTSRHVIAYKHVRPQVHNNNNIITITTTIALRFRRGFYAYFFFRDSYTRNFNGKTNVFCTRYFSKKK